jgi:anti-anti-sigma factor
LTPEQEARAAVRLAIVRPSQDVCVVHALGEVDLTTVAELDSTLRQVQEDGHTNVVLDLWDVTFIDSVGIGVLLSARRRAEKGVGGFAVIAEPRGPVQDVFDLAGLRDSLSVFATRAMATSALRSGPLADLSPLATQTMCERCERRFAQHAVPESGRCPLCDGKLVPLGGRLYPPEPLEPRAEEGVRENGNR